jgi:hypothetical protein
MIKKLIPNISNVINVFFNGKLIRKFIPDIFSVVLISVIAFLAASKPAIDINIRQFPGVPAKSIMPEAKKEKGIVRLIVTNEAIKNIKERNIFVTTGAYTESTAQNLPDNPYALIAVLQGKEKKAVFRDYLGNVLTLPVGGKLIDGFVITGIDVLSVSMQKRNERKNLRLFNTDGTGGLALPASEQGASLPKNLYTLIGIMAGKEKKAAFKDYRGSVAILATGEKLPDGSVITNIDNSTVHLKKGNEKKELKIFDMHNTEQAIRNKH